MDKLKLFNDEVIGICKTSAIVKNNKKYRVYIKGKGICSNEYDNYIKLNNRMYVMYTGRNFYYCKDLLLLVDGDIMLENSINNTIENVYDELARLIDEHMTLNDWINQKPINRYSICVKSFKKESFFITEVATDWKRTNISHIYSAKNYEELLKDYKVCYIRENTKDCILACCLDANNEYRYILINSTGKILLNSIHNIHLEDKNNNVWAEDSTDKLYKIKNGEIEKTCKMSKGLHPGRMYMSTYLGSKRCIYLDKVEAIKKVISIAANGVYTGVTIKEFNNVNVKDMYGTDYGDMDKLQYIYMANIVIVYMGDKVGILNLDPLTFTELKNVKKIRMSCCRERGLAIIFKDNTYKFYFNGKLTDKAEGWLIKHKVENTRISKTAYICMDKKYNWYITDVNGEIIINEKYTTYEEAKEDFLSYINATGIRKSITDIVLYNENK